MRLACLAAASLAIAAPAAAQEPPAAARTVAGLPTLDQVGLRWGRGPTLYDIMFHHRRTSRDFPNRGFAEVACTPDGRGRLTCRTAYEDPPGEDYGRAALAVMRPVTVAAVDGYSPEGREFGFRIRFGLWPERLLPDSFHPVAQNLRWVQRPSIDVAALPSLGRDEEARASFRCVADAVGKLACQTTGSSGRATPDFVRAGAEALAQAQVERADNGELAGSPLNWTFRIVNQSNCGGAPPTALGRPDAGRGAQPGGGVGPTVDPLGPLTSTGGSAARSTSGGTCVRSLVQVH